MKLKANSLEGWELEKQQNQRQQQMFKKEAKFKHKQQQEVRALKKRITSGRQTQKRQRQFDLERCAYCKRVLTILFGPFHLITCNRPSSTRDALVSHSVQAVAAIPERQAGVGAAAKFRAYTSREVL